MSIDPVFNSLEEWREKYLQLNSTGELSTLYEYSPEWLALWVKVWREYEDLEARRRALPSSVRLPWQDGIEVPWSEQTLRLEAWCKPMRDELWIMCPLAVHKDRHLHQNTQDRRFAWKATLQNWHSFCQHYETDPSLALSLSTFQSGSFLLLREWWSSSYNDQSYVADARKAMESLASSPDSTSPVDTLQQWQADCLYNSFLLELFVREFHPRAWEPFKSEQSLDTLQSIRFRALDHATTQRLAWATLKGVQNDGIPIYSNYPRVYLQKTSATDIYSPPYFLWDVEKRQTILTENLNPTPKYTCVSHTWGRTRTNTDVLIPGVPWPVPGNRRYDVRSLPDELACLGPRYVWFDLFCIPQDDLNVERREIEIARQADIFRGSQACVAWLNHLESWDRVRHALDWMALTYLRNTNRKTVKTLDEKLCETVASSNLSVELMKPRNILDKIDNGEVDVMDIGITLLDDDATTEPIGWFTSLWTLQEAVLCPDLHLFSRAWERLNDRNGSAISLSALFLFLRCTEPHCKADGPQEPTFTDPLEYECVLSRVERMDIPRVFPEWPRGPQLMKRFLNATQFDTVIETPALSQISVIVNANSRVSSGNRAPAIMSAIGITDWYLARIAQPSSERKPETLVFGSFPLAFVREAAVKLGGPFYEAIPCQAQTRLKKRHVLFSHKAVGSMLPFSRVQGTMGSNIPTVSSLSCLYPISHPTVKSWVIRKNGSVRMKAVGIIMASKWPAVESNNQSKVPAIFSWAKEDGSGGLTATTVDFQYILSQFAGNDKIYAVSLWHDQGFQHGVLLQSPRFRGIGRRQLVRIGSFDITNVPIPEPTGVNWLVI